MAVVLISIAITSTASATILGTTNIQNHNNSLSDHGNLWGGGLDGGSYYTGIYSWTNEISGSTGLGTQVPDWGFCIELTQDAHNGNVNVIPLEEGPLPVTAVTPMGTIKENYIRELWGRDFDQNWITNPTTANKQMAEAFGVCLWEIIYETDKTTGGAPIWDVTSGTGFHATGIEQAATANSWLSQLDGNTAYFANNLYAISTLNGQDYLVQVPEPTTVCILGLGALSLIRRRK